MALELDTPFQETAAPAPQARQAAALPFTRRTVTGQDRMFFTEQLALLLETGTSLYGALEALRNQTANPALREVVEKLLADVAEGRSFSNALARHPEVFPGSYVNLIAASESGGFMHEILYELLQMEEKREQLKSTLVSAFSYPAFLLAFSFAVVIFVLIVVFPKFGDLFISIQDQLPATTKILMAMSDILRQHWIYVLGGSGAVLVGGLRWADTAAGNQTLDRLKLRMPVVRDIFTQLYLVQLLRVLGLSLANGVTVVDALQASREVVDNSVFRRFLDGIQNLVEEGRGLAAGFQEADFVPPTVKHMVSTAEESGNLAKVMSRLADFNEAQLAKRLATFSKMAEPIMLLVMGAVVGLLVSSLILPIFKLSRAVS